MASRHMAHFYLSEGNFAIRTSNRISCPPSRNDAHLHKKSSVPKNFRIFNLSNSIFYTHTTPALSRLLGISRADLATTSVLVSLPSRPTLSLAQALERCLPPIYPPPAPPMGQSIGKFSFLSTLMPTLSLQNAPLPLPINHHRTKTIC